MGTHQLAGSSRARGVSFAGYLVLDVAAPGWCLWGGGLPWLHVLGCNFLYFFWCSFLCFVSMCDDTFNVLVWDLPFQGPLLAHFCL